MTKRRMQPVQSRFVDVCLPDGKLVFRYDPTRALVEVQHRRVKHVIDLTKIVQPLDKRKDVCYDTG